ncbi:MAG: anti-sigma factor antagonist [Actinomycetota bacterium]|nr:anti-sigma factor antagonist [Actinomycetota bacterium]
MNFTLERHDSLQAAVVHVEGDIDAATVPGLREALEGLIATGHPNIVLDLSRVDYVDSSALGMLVWLDRRLQDGLGRVVLAGANRDVRRILAMSRIVTVSSTLCQERDVDAALCTIEPILAPAAELWCEEMQVAADVGLLAGVREKVSALIEPMGFSSSAVFDIKVALGEALANAVRHGSAHGPGEVTVLVHGYDEKVVLEIVDCGSGFDGEHVCSDDLYASGGRGILFMRALMDDVEFATASEGGTTVKLVKHRMPVELEK